MVSLMLFVNTLDIYLLLMFYSIQFLLIGGATLEQTDQDEDTGM